MSDVDAKVIEAQNRLIDALFDKVERLTRRVKDLESQQNIAPERPAEREPQLVDMERDE